MVPQHGPNSLSDVGKRDGDVLHVLGEQYDEEDHGQSQLGALPNV